MYKVGRLRVKVSKPVVQSLCLSWLGVMAKKIDTTSSPPQGAKPVSDKPFSDKTTHPLDPAMQTLLNATCTIIWVLFARDLPISAQ